MGQKERFAWGLEFGNPRPQALKTPSFQASFAISFRGRRVDYSEALNPKPQTLKP